MSKDAIAKLFDTANLPPELRAEAENLQKLIFGEGTDANPDKSAKVIEWILNHPVKDANGGDLFKWFERPGEMGIKAKNSTDFKKQFVALLMKDNLSDAQLAAYYVDLQKGKALAEFLSYHYGDNIVGKNETTLQEWGYPGSVENPNGKDVPTRIIENDINLRLEVLESMGMKAKLSQLVADNLGAYLKYNDNPPAGATDADPALKGKYTELQGVLQSNLFSPDAYLKFTQNPDGTEKTFQQTIGGLLGAQQLARSYLTPDDFKANSAALSNTYEKVINHEIGLGASKWTVGDPPPADAWSNDASYKKWYNALPENSIEKVSQGIVDKSWEKSDVAKSLIAQGYGPGTDAYNQYMNAFKKDFTLNFNNWVGTIRRDTKMDALARLTSEPPDWLKSTKMNLGAGPTISENMLTRGVWHSIQSATVAGALAGLVLNEQGDESVKKDPRTALAITYGAVTLGDMLLETASKFANPKNGGFVSRWGLVDRQSWQHVMDKYVGNPRNIEASGRILAGLGSGVFGAYAFWGMANAIRDNQPIAATFQALNAFGSVAQGVSLGAEGLAQVNSLLRTAIRPYAPVTFSAEAGGLVADEAAIASAEATFRFGTSVVGWVGGVVAGLGLYGLWLNDLAKGVKPLNQALQQAHDYDIRPLTGWDLNFEWRTNPGDSF